MYNLKIVLLPLQNKKIMPACCNLKILAWESKAYSFCDHMKVSDVSYPRHVICYLQGSAQLQGLDEERLAKMAEHLNQYNCQLSSMGPGFQTVSGQWPVSFILLIIHKNIKEKWTSITVSYHLWDTHFKLLVGGGLLASSTT